jgi:hydrogenase expression/formation protein HypE
MGKLANKELQKLLSCIKKDPRVIIPPQVGYDAGVHRLGDKYVVVATDPCIDVPEEWFGWLLIHYAASDMALFGAKPEFCTVTLMGPCSTKPKKFQKIMKQTCNAASELNIAIVRGHTGTYESTSQLTGVCTVYGTVEKEKLITPGNAKPGDYILCTKPIGLETAVNFSLTHKRLAQRIFGTEQAENLAKQVRMQSCVKEALQLAKSGSVRAMHDATEGGFVAALNEIAEASKLGFNVQYEKLPMLPEVKKLQDAFRLSDEQVLALSSTGAILAAVKPEKKDEATEVLRKNGLEACFVGEFTKNTNRILMKNKKQTCFPEVADDPYARILLGKI